MTPRATLKGLPGRLLHRPTPQDVASFALLLVALSVVAFGLTWMTEDWEGWLLAGLIGGGLLLGWILSASRLPDWLVLPLGIILGFGIALFHIGRLDIVLTEAIVALTDQTDTSILLALSALLRDAGTLLARGGEGLFLLIRGRSLTDPVAVALLWEVASWIVAFWAGWMVQRHNRPLWGVSPAGFLLVAKLAAEEAQAHLVLIFLISTLLMFSLRRQNARENAWWAGKTNLDVRIRRPLMLWTGSLSAALVLAAALIPSFSPHDLIERLRPQRTVYVYVVVSPSEWVDEESGFDLVGASDRVRFIGLPQSHLIGSSPDLSDQPVMAISPSELRPDLRELPRGYYWRSVTYDQYNGRGWFSEEPEMAGYEAGQPAITTTLPFQQVVRQQVEIRADLGGLLYSAGTLVTADYDFLVAWRSADDPFGAFSGATANPPLEPGAYRTYEAESLVPIVREEELRASGADYPEWVQDRYLSLPAEVTDRVRRLARDLTATSPTPYDRAVAIESYLRTFPYTLDIPLPPEDQDVADFFLFDLRSGYCDYYATAMVVLARAAGLPARLVAGYATGAYDPDNARYIVTEADAHAWVEVYFPG